MKKLFLLMITAGGCLAASAQNPVNPDTAGRYNLNPDSLRNQQTLNQPEFSPQTDTGMNRNAAGTQQKFNTDSMNASANNKIPDSMNNGSVTDNMNTGQNTTADSSTNVYQPSTNYPVNNGMTRGVNNTNETLTGLQKWSALPLLATWVPQDVVDKMKNEYGDKLYDITMLKVGENKYAYAARIQQDGMYTSVFRDGSDVTSNIQPQ